MLSWYLLSYLPDRKGGGAMGTGGANAPPQIFEGGRSPPSKKTSAPPRNSTRKMKNADADFEESKTIVFSEWVSGLKVKIEGFVPPKTRMCPPKLGMCYPQKFFVGASGGSPACIYRETWTHTSPLPDVSFYLCDHMSQYDGIKEGKRCKFTNCNKKTRTFCDKCNVHYCLINKVYKRNCVAMAYRKKQTK